MKVIKLNDKKYFHTINGLWTGKTENRQSTLVLRNTNFRNNGTLNYDDIATIEADKKELTSKLLQRNDIIIEKSGGGPNTPVGRVVLFKGEENLFSFSNFCSRLRIINNQILPEYVFLFLFGLHINGKTEKLQTNTTNLRNLIGRKYFSIGIPYITLEDQRIFVQKFQARLDHVEKMREAALKQKEAAKALQAAALREAFYLNKKDKLPVGWEKLKIRDIAYINEYKDKKTHADNKLTSFIPMENIDPFKGIVYSINERPYNEVKKGYTYFENGDIVFAKITPCMQNGNCAIVENLIDGFGFGSTEFIVFKTKNPLHTRYLYHFLRTAEFRKDAEDHFTGSAGQQRVPIDFIKDYLMPIPTDDTIVNKIIGNITFKLDKIYKVIENNDTQLSAIDNLPKAILRETFSFEKTKE